MRRFAQLGVLDNGPGQTTILNFRCLLETHNLAAWLLEALNAHLAHKDQSLRAGTIIDATLIARMDGAPAAVAAGKDNAAWLG